MNEEIFRKKGLDKVKSPESLDDYIQVSNPSVWLLLISVIVLLAGACVWGIFGSIESSVNTSVYAENGEAVCIIAEKDIDAIKPGMTVKCDDFKATIIEIGKKENQNYICPLQTEQTIPDGFYQGSIVTKNIRPISFVLN